MVWKKLLFGQNTPCGWQRLDVNGGLASDYTAQINTHCNQGMQKTIYEHTKWNFETDGLKQHILAALAQSEHHLKTTGYFSNVTDLV